VRIVYAMTPSSTSETVVVPAGLTNTVPVLFVDRTLPAPPVRSKAVSVKTWFPVGTLSEAVQVYEPGALGFGEQFGEAGVRLMTTGFAPSVRMRSDCVLGEMYAGLSLEAFGVTLPLDAGCCADCGVSGAFAGGGGTDAVLPPLLHPLKTAPHNDAARIACAKRLANFESLALLIMRS
jgi:hypothetical protein